MNKREQIRNAVVELLKRSNVSNGNICDSRVTPITEDELPVVVVSIDSESSEMVSRANGSSQKCAQLAIEVVNAASTEVEDYLDKVTAKIERLMLSDQTLGDIVNHTELKQTDIAILREGDIPMGIARMSFDISYFADFMAELVELNEFKGVDLKWTS